MIINKLLIVYNIVLLVSLPKICETRSQGLYLETLLKGSIEGGSKGTSFERDSPHIFLGPSWTGLGLA